MITENGRDPARKTMIIISMLILMVTALPVHFAWGMRSASGLESNETCMLTLQLKEDANVKNRYVAMVISATQQFGSNVQSVDEMYANVSKASVEEDDRGVVSFLGKRNIREFGNTQDTDSATALCLGCHDGAAARVITVDVRNNPFVVRNTLATSHFDHPVGMDYNRYVAYGNRYKPTANPKMIFINGKVGCLTCHDPFNPEMGHLVMSDRRSALCLTCHNK